jgi:hypothetical protein
VRFTRWLRPLVFVPLLALLSLTAWGLSSPVGSSPDDNFHLVSIWCATGVRAGDCAQPADNPNARTVPRSLLDANCYAGDSTKSAACQGRNFGTDPQNTVEATHANFIGLYPPVFYFVMSAFVGPNVDISVIVMRTFNAALFVGLITALFLLLPFHRRATLLWGTAIAMVPFGMFLVPSTNPSGWAILSAATVWISLVGYYESSGRRKIGLGIVATAATVIGAGARADAATYACLAIVVAVILTFRRDRRYLLESILPFGLAIVSVLFYFSASQSTGIESKVPFNLGFAVLDFLNVPSLWTGALGTWGLGSLDTPMVPAVWVSSIVAFCGMVFFGLGIRRRRKSVVVALVFAALWLVPTVVLVQARAEVGSFVQPRYILPIMVILGGIALLQRRSTVMTPSMMQRVAVVGALSLANSMALYTNIRRYVTGLDVTGWNLNAHDAWWWSGLGVSPMVIWIAGSLTFAATLVLATAAWDSDGRLRFSDRTERNRTEAELISDAPARRLG